MASSKKLKNITVSHSPNQVGISFFFSDAPTDHFLLSMQVARDFRDKLDSAIRMACAPPVPADNVGVSEYVKVSISTPKEH